jgi:hypothetical protein
MSYNTIIKQNLVNLYVDINPINKKIFYVGIGNDCRIRKIKRNKLHQEMVDTFPNKKFVRKVLYKKISIDKAWFLEKQIIKKCGRIINNTGYLTNIHAGGNFLKKDDNWIDWRKGKNAKEIYGKQYSGPANKGKTYKHFRGDDYIFPTSKPFFIQIDNEDPIFCESETFFCKTFNSNDILLRKLKKTKEKGHLIKRQLNSSHYFSDKSMIKLFLCKIEDRIKIDKNILNSIIERQKIKINEWIINKNNKKPKRKYNWNSPTKPFYAIIDNKEPLYFYSENDFCKKFKCDRSFVLKIKKSHNMTYIVRKSGNSKHVFENNTVIKLEWFKEKFV